MRGRMCICACCVGVCMCERVSACAHTRLCEGLSERVSE